MTDDHPLAIMVNADPPWPHWLVGEVLETGHLPGELVTSLFLWFHAIQEDVGPLLMDR